ncbi:MAG TPA: hypothetical protein VE402_05855, partial [Candidatus Angelobacter sp.]|nr:hypothetical protein [Candidatus Angelobacter sp.]
MISSILGPVVSVEREARPAVSSGYSSSRHEILAVALRDGGKVKLRLKRTHLGEDWLARLSREEPPGREASLLGETALLPVWEAFARAHLAYAVQGSEIGLLMRDHSDGLVPDVREPIATSHEDALLRALSSLHARFWESPALS